MQRDPSGVAFPTCPEAIGIEVVPGGARLRTRVQKLSGTVTRAGLTLDSTADGAGGSLGLRAVALGREREPMAPLPTTGEVAVGDKTVAWVRDGLIEEFSVSVDGLRQDFVVESAPNGAGELCLDLALSGAAAAAAARGVRLTLDGSGRVLAYSRMNVTDATGRTLPARIEVLAADRLAVRVDDAGALYPVRIDPTFAGDGWESLDTTNVGNYIFALVLDADGNLYAGGSFTSIAGVSANRIAKWNGSGWSALGKGVGEYSGDCVLALAMIGNDLYVGGGFATAGGNAANNIAKWDGNNWSSLETGTEQYVFTLAVSGYDLFAGGQFITAGGKTVNRIAKWDTIIRTWSALGSGVDAMVSALAVSGRDLYVGGAFWNAGAVSAKYVAKWDGSAWSPLGPGLDAPVNALAVSGRDLYVGGQFNTAGGTTASRVAKWDGSAWSPLGSGVDMAALGWGQSGNVMALVVIGSELYAGGDFTKVGGVSAPYIAKWNGSSWLGLVTNVNAHVSALAADSVGRLFVGGTFSQVGTEAAGGIAQVSLADAGTKLPGTTVPPVIAEPTFTDAEWVSLNAHSSAVIASLVLDGKGNLYAGGEFTSIGGVAANNIAKWDGTAWSPLGLGTSGGVLALRMIGDDLYAAGEFEKAGGETVNRIAKWDSKASTWSALGSGVDPTIHALAVMGKDLYVGGRFGTAGGQAVNCIAKWDSNAGTWSPLGSGMTCKGSVCGVYALEVIGSTLYAGGRFWTAGGVRVNSIAQWNSNTNAWSPLNLGMDNDVTALAVIGNELYAGGDFDKADGKVVNRISKWNGTAWLALGSGVDPAVDALAVIGSDLYAGGYFPVAGGTVVNGIAKWNGRTWSPLGSGMGIAYYSGVQALAADSAGNLFVGGRFSKAGSVAAYGIARAIVGNRAPTDITLSNSKIAENNPENAVIGTLKATDVNAGQTHIFTLVSGAGSTDNGDFTVTGNTLTINTRANFEAKSSYAIRIRATDNGRPTLSCEKEFTITVTDVAIPQIITFGPQVNKTFGDAPFTLSATGGGSRQPVTFSIVSGPATVNGNTVTITGAGIVTVRASQAGSGDYSAATPVEQKFSVGKAAQAITFNRPENVEVNKATELSATGGGSGNPVMFAIENGSASLVGAVLTASGPGDVTVRASQAGNASYADAPDVKLTITVTAAANTTPPVTTVPDTRPPVITVPKNIVETLAQGATTKVVNFTASAVDANDVAVSVPVTSSPASGTTFGIGETTVTLTATDARGNEATATFTITLNQFGATGAYYAGSIYNLTKNMIGYSWLQFDGTAKSPVTGRVFMRGGSYIVSAQLGTNKQAQQILKLKGYPDIAFNLQISADNSVTLNVTVNSFDPNFPPSDQSGAATLVRGAYQGDTPASQVGGWSVLLPGDTLASTGATTVAVPAGSGYATMTVSSNGFVRMTGRTPNNDPFTADALITRGSGVAAGSDSLEFYARPESAGTTVEILTGSVTFATTPDSDFSGAIRITRTAGGDGPYNQGFSLSGKIIGCRYTAANFGMLPTPFTSTELKISFQLPDQTAVNGAAFTVTPGQPRNNAPAGSTTEKLFSLKTKAVVDTGVVEGTRTATTAPGPALLAGIIYPKGVKRVEGLVVDNNGNVVRFVAI